MFGECVFPWSVVWTLIHIFVLSAYFIRHSFDLYALLVFDFLAPGSAPRNVRARPHSTQTIRIDWDEPEIPNGIIKV